MQNAVVTATVTDANGCTAICTTSIHAEDVRCFAGSSGISKVTLCHQTGSTKNPCVKICVDESAVAEHLAHGDFLGNCTSNCTAPVTAGGRSGGILPQDEIILSELLKIKAWPNPTENYFTLRIQSGSNENIQLKVFDISGKQLYINRGSAGQSYRFGSSFVAGVYIAEVRQGTNRSIIKIIKQ